MDAPVKLYAPHPIKGKSKTQKSWGGYWSINHGPLTAFLKAHSDLFTILRNKYVVLAGTEGSANIPPEPVMQPPLAPTPQPQAPVQKPITGVPLNILVSHLLW